MSRQISDLSVDDFPDGRNLAFWSGFHRVTEHAEMAANSGQTR